MAIRTRPVLVAALLLSAFASGLPAGASAQTTTLPPIQVQLSAARATGPSGLAILSAADTGTAVQVLAQNAPDGTTATIHLGACASVGDLVGLIGELSTTGQAQAIVPVGLGQVADGTHVVVLHAGLDLTTNLACGLIPLTDVGTVIPPLSSPGAPLPSVAPPVIGAGCEGMDVWLSATQARFDRIQVLTDAANRAAAGTDVQAYLSVVATNIGEIQAMLSLMQTEAVPAAAAAAQEQLAQALQAGMDGGTLVIQAFTESNADLYQQAVVKSQESTQALLKTKTMVGELRAKCPAAPVG